MREWMDGNVYCIPCITCPHDEEGHNGVCTTCVRRLHTVMTFEGPRITDIAYYVAMAWDEYSIDVEDLMSWTYAEQGLLNEHYTGRARQRVVVGVRAPPPHHRFG